MAPLRAVYTVITGRYESLNEQEGIDRDGLDFICFTDDPELRSAGWDIRVVKRTFASDPVRNQRLLKILGHESLQRYSETLYVDNAVELKASPATILDEWISDDNIDIAVPLHSYRESVLDEFDELIADRYDDPARLYEQLLHYSFDYPDVLERRPFWTAMLARRNTPRLRQAMRIWANHVLRYSRRDQLSARIALELSDAVVRPMEIDNFVSEWHAWPRDFQREVRQGKSLARTAGPFAADLRRFRRERDEARAHEAEANAKAAAALDEVKAAQDEVVAAERLAEERLAALQEVWQSTSWRVTGPLRAIRRRH